MPARVLFHLFTCLIGAIWLGCAEPAPSDFDRGAVLEEARGLLREGKFDEAVEFLREPASARDLDPRISQAYGRALILNQQASLAIFPLERVISQPDASPGSRALFIQALLGGGGALEAIREASAFLDEFPEHENVRRLRAEAYEGSLMMEEALEDLSYLVDSRPEDARAVEAKLDLLIELERVDEARDSLEELDALMQREGVLPSVKANFCAAHARFEHDQGDSSKALTMLDACVLEFPKDPTVLLSRVDVLEAVQGEAAATAFLEEVAQTTPGRFRVQYALGSRLHRQGRIEDAEAVMLRASETVGGAQPSLALADFRVSQRDFKGASEAVLAGIRLQLGHGPGDPDFVWSELPVEAQFAFGDLFITAEDFEHASQIIEVVDQDAYRLILEARMFLAQDEPAKAIETYEQAFRLWPANSGARYLAGVAAMKLGDFDQAAAYYQDALRSDAAANDAGLVLANMQLAQGYPGAAVDTLGTYSRENAADPHAMRLFGKAAVMAGLFEHGEGARARLAQDLDWAGIALADQALDVARVRGLATGIEYIEGSAELFLPTHFEALTVWVDLLVLSGEGDRAAAKVKSLHHTNPEEAGFAVVWARILARDQEWEKARLVLEPIAEANPSLLAAQRDMGTLLMNLDETEAALARFERADRLDPLDASASLLACEGLIQNGETELAKERLESLLMRHPWQGRAALRLAQLRVDENDLGERTQVLARQAARFSSVAGPEAFVTLGRVEYKVGHPEEAVIWLEKGIAQGAATPGDRYVFATALIESGRQEAGGRELKLLLSGPDFPEKEAARATLDAISSKSAG